MDQPYILAPPLRKNYEITPKMSPALRSVGPNFETRPSYTLNQCGGN